MRNEGEGILGNKVHIVVARTEFSLEFREGVRVGEIWGGVTNHIKASMLNIKGICLLKALKFKRLKYTGENILLYCTIKGITCS